MKDGKTKEFRRRSFFSPLPLINHSCLPIKWHQLPTKQYEKGRKGHKWSVGFADGITLTDMGRETKPHL
jgi:hypothetical protein